MVSTLPRIPIFEAIKSHDPNSTCVIHSASGRRFTYGGLLKDVAQGKDRLVKEAGGKIEGERIAFLIENSYDYVGAHHTCT
jgi:malonyl-CoA/methylmalonyl-CoA synthetase